MTGEFLSPTIYSQIITNANTIIPGFSTTRILCYAPRFPVNETAYALALASSEFVRPCLLHQLQKFLPVAV